ncbi:MAG: hypothetical protein R2697_22755 [Ilumatobacteraceae bacterium]
MRRHRRLQRRRGHLRGSGRDIRRHQDPAHDDDDVVDLLDLVDLVDEPADHDDHVDDDPPADDHHEHDDVHDETTTTTSTTTSTTAPPGDHHDPAGGTADDERARSIWDNRPPSAIPAPPLPAGWVTQSIGTSVLGREITLLHRPVENERARAVVIGAVHGNEPVDPPIVRPRRRAAPRRRRGLARPRNEPRRRRRRHPPTPTASTSTGTSGGDGRRTTAVLPVLRTGDDGGREPRPVGGAAHGGVGPSAARLHQLDRVDARRVRGGVVARLGVRVRRDVTQHGGGESWTNFTAGFPSMLIEADGWDATPEMVAAHRNGFAEMIAVFG